MSKKVKHIVFGLICCFTLITGVVALSGSLTGVNLTAYAAKGTLQSSSAMSTRYNTSIRATSISGVNEIGIKTERRQFLIWFTNDELSEVISDTYTHSNGWQIGGSFVTRFQWQKRNGGGTMIANVSYTDI